MVLKVIPLVILLVSIIAVNLLYLVAAWKTKQTRRKPSKLFFAISMSDLMVGAVALPSGLIFGWVSASDAVCGFFQTIKYIPPLTSCSLTLAITLDRYLILLYRVNLKLKYLALLVVTYILILAIPDVLNFFLYKTSKKYFDTGPPFYAMLAAGSIFVILFPILYLHLLVFIKRNSRKSQSLSCHSQYGNRVTKTILSVLLSQVSWYFVHMMSRCYLTIFVSVDVNKNITFALIYLMYVSMCMNSITSTVILIWRNMTVRRYLCERLTSLINIFEN